MTFKELGLTNCILDAIEKGGYIKPSIIQEQAIPYIINKQDLLGCAQTGTGKTAAFALPVIHNLLLSNDERKTQKKIKVLVLTPTRELAVQTRDNFRKFSINTNLKCGVVLGGVNQKSQLKTLKAGVDILVATPGRLLDLLNQGHINLKAIEMVVLDEADVMLDMGFIVDVKKIIKYLPDNKQTLMFSATISKEINNLVESLLRNYVTVKVNNESLTVEKIDQSLYFVDKTNKAQLLLELLNNNDIESALIFTRTKHGASKLAEFLNSNGINNGVIHGNKSQSARIFALNNFKNRKTKVLVATDIAARGIDINKLSHVINFEMPDTAESYVHRIGRTGRAGLYGIAISLCNIDEMRNLWQIEKLINQKIKIIDNHNYPMKVLEKSPKNELKQKYKKKPSNKYHNSKNVYKKKSN